MREGVRGGDAAHRGGPGAGSHATFLGATPGRWVSAPAGQGGLGRLGPCLVSERCSRSIARHVGPRWAGGRWAGDGGHLWMLAFWRNPFKGCRLVLYEFPKVSWSPAGAWPSRTGVLLVYDALLAERGRVGRSPLPGGAAVGRGEVPASPGGLRPDAGARRGDHAARRLFVLGPLGPIQVQHCAAR